jgi:hypothetical protein
VLVVVFGFKRRTEDRERKRERERLTIGQYHTLTNGTVEEVKKDGCAYLRIESHEKLLS